MVYNIYFMVIRYNGLNDVAVNYIMETVSKYNSIVIKGVYPIEWSQQEKKDNLLNFYKHVDNNEIIVKNILEVNGLIMVGMVLLDNNPIPPPVTEKVSGKNWNMISIKRSIRNKFGNVIHLSDSTETAYNEIYKLLSMKKNEVDILIKNKYITFGSTTTNNSLAKQFNKIKSGTEVLWTPTK